MEISLVLSVFKELREWILGLDKNKIEHNKQDENSLKAVYMALAETKIYHAARKEGPRDMAREHQIAKLWYDASIATRSISKDLAVRCFLKAGYWTDPNNWEGNDGEQLSISIDEMTKLSKQLLY